MPAYIYVLGLVVLLVAMIVNPKRRKGPNRANYWGVPTAASFLTVLVAERNLGGALGAAGLTLAVMGFFWLKYYRPGPGMLNK